MTVKKLKGEAVVKRRAQRARQQLERSINGEMALKEGGKWQGGTEGGV